jgi:hypothetical protein
LCSTKSHSIFFFINILTNSSPILIRPLDFHQSPLPPPHLSGQMADAQLGVSAFNATFNNIAVILWRSLIVKLTIVDVSLKMTHSQARFSLSMTCTSHVWNLSLRCLKISCLVLSFVLCFVYFYIFSGPSWSWSYGSWIYNYLCNQCLSPLKLWVRIPFMAMCTRYNIILIYIYMW